MNILHVTPSFYPAHVYGGTTQSVYELCCELTRQGCNVKVLTTNTNGLGKSLNVDTKREVEIYPNLNVRYCRRWARHSISPMLLRLLKSYVLWADVVHLTAVYSFPTFLTLCISKKLNKPLVWSPRGALQHWGGSRRPLLKSYWNHFCRFLAPKKFTLHVTSEEEAKESSVIFPDQDMQIIPNGVHVSEIEIQAKERKGILCLLYLGRLDPKKGIENLLFACKILKDRSTLKWVLTIAGSGDLLYCKKIDAMIRELGLVSYVQRVGQVLGEEKKEIFKKSDILVVPSYTENFGIVVAEGLSFGIPVIASHGTPWKQLKEKGCGLWVSNDPESLVQAIEKMQWSPLNEMGIRGKKWMEEEFSWGMVGEQMKKVYQDRMRS